MSMDVLRSFEHLQWNVIVVVGCWLFRQSRQNAFDVLRMLLPKTVSEMCEQQKYYGNATCIRLEGRRPANSFEFG